ncbi:hypothetical protein BDZ91DRAFT_239286 [Kalaharituber pfeilii]|nr:hypothetical protein BDZ91DRAFT_239286 [Kalaharituber pfeilii]
MVSLTTVLSLTLLSLSTLTFAATTPRPSCPECTDTPNNCDITAPCTSAFGQRLLCGCRPGFRATGVDPKDTTKQWRLNVPYHEHRVWVAPGVKCDTLCNWPYGAAACEEVPFLDQCVKFPPP